MRSKEAAPAARRPPPVPSPPLHAPGFDPVRLLLAPPRPHHLDALAGPRDGQPFDVFPGPRRGVLHAGDHGDALNRSVDVGLVDDSAADAWDCRHHGPPRLRTAVRPCRPSCLAVTGAASPPIRVNAAVASSLQVEVSRAASYPRRRALGERESAAPGSLSTDPRRRPAAPSRRHASATAAASAPCASASA